MNVRSLAAATAALGLAVAPAALAHGGPGTHGKAHQNAKQQQAAKTGKCRTHHVAYRVAGTVVTADLTQTRGTDTTRRNDDRYSGTLTVAVTRTNHHARDQRGTQQTYQLSDVAVRAGHGVTLPSPAAGSRVRVHGRLTRLNRRCDQTGFTPTVTVRRVVFHAAQQQDQSDQQDQQQQP